MGQLRWLWINWTTWQFLASVQMSGTNKACWFLTSQPAIREVVRCPHYGALSMVALWPKTGRYRQLRRHLAEAAGGRDLKDGYMMGTENFKRHDFFCWVECADCVARSCQRCQSCPFFWRCLADLLSTKMKALSKCRSLRKTWNFSIFRSSDRTAILCCTPCRSLPSC